MPIGFLGVAWLIPAQAQELQQLTFAIGGGISAPLNPTAKYVGVSGNFVTGAGVNINKNSSIEGDFMWSGLPPSLSVLHPINAPFGSMNLYTLNGDYRYHFDSIGGSIFGAYVIGGGGWYYRYASISKNYDPTDWLPADLLLVGIRLRSSGSCIRPLWLTRAPAPPA